MAELRLDGCSVCTLNAGQGCTMQCGHAFCHACFARYIAGSVAELRSRMRCCICGWLNILIREDHEATPLNDFGRNREPRLEDPVGISTRSNGDFVVTDANQKRVFVFDRRGVCTHHFAHLHGVTATAGTAVTQDDRIVIPLHSATCSNLAYYTIEGAFLRSAHFGGDVDLGGVAVTSTNKLIVTDSTHANFHVINDSGRTEQTFQVPQLQGERFHPRPHGVAVNSYDDVIITDAANHCVKVFGSEGQFLYKFGCPGERSGQFCNPAGVCTDSSDRIVVTDPGNQRVQLFSKEGEFRCFIVRYNRGSDVSVAPVDVTQAGCDEVAVMLRGTKDACVGEVRIYECRSTLRKMNYIEEI